MAFTVSKEFKWAFDMCMKHYGVVEDELEYEKQRVRANYHEAEKCYESIANGIRKLNKEAA